jgi:ADP-heptose:LPS heptosyltransferase
MLCGVRYRLGYEGTKYLTHTSVFISSLPEYERYQRILFDNGLTTLRSLPKLKKPDIGTHRKKMELNHGQKVLGIFPKGGNNPGTEMDIKKLDFEKYIELAKMINSEFPELKIIFFEGIRSDEKFKLPDEIKAMKDTIKNELIACCDYFISGDTGSLHIAAAMEIPTVSIFGPSDPRILAPVNSDNSVKKHFYVWKKPECSPCYTPETAIDKTNRKYWKNNTFICHTGTHMCMKSVFTDEIFNEFQKLIEVIKQVN